MCFLNYFFLSGKNLKQLWKENEVDLFLGDTYFMSITHFWVLVLWNCVIISLQLSMCGPTWHFLICPESWTLECAASLRGYVWGVLGRVSLAGCSSVRRLLGGEGGRVANSHTWLKLPTRPEAVLTLLVHVYCYLIWVLPTHQVHTKTWPIYQKCQLIL